MLAMVTLASYMRVSQFGFVNFDDQEYVKDNPHVQNGVTGENLRWAFTQVYACNWHPLTWISHMLDCQFFGLNPGAHHLINVGLHIVNLLLLFNLLQQMTGATWRSAMVAGLFALHPSHVESVAWISERKDILSTLFALLALLVYTRKALRSGSTALQMPVSSTAGSAAGLLSLGDIWPALLFYALSLLSKGMYVTLPFLLLLLDGWPLRRYPPEAPGIEQMRRFAQLAREKWPWLILSLVMSAITFWVQKTGGAVVPISELSFRARLANALIAYVRYVGKMFWPADLTAIYPLPAAWAGWQIAAAAFTLVLLSGVAVLLLRKRPCVFVGWAWFVGTLVPVIGLVQVGSQALADRYTYFPFVGLFIIVVWMGAEIFSHGQRLRLLGASLSAVILLACTVLTRRQVEHWSSSRALFERAVAVTRDNAQAQCNLGNLFEAENRLSEAAKHYAEAVRILPADPDFRTCLGVVLARVGDTNAARVHLNLAIVGYLDLIRKQPAYVVGFNGVGMALSALAEHRDAVEAYAKAVSLKPESAVYRNNLGVALARTGDLRGAIAEHREVLRLNPRHAQAACNLGAELVSAGRVDEAIPYLEQAVRLDPNYSEAHSNLGGALARKGDHPAAISHYETALQLDPRLARTHLNLGISLNKTGRLDEATPHLAEAVRLEPGNLDAQYNLGRNLYLRGNASEAVTHLETVLKTSPENASAQFYLGQARASLRQMDPALAHLRAAVRLRPDWPDALGALAWILATAPDIQHRNGGEALTLVQTISTVTDQRQPTLLDTLAAAYAEVGRFDDAVLTAQRALDRARSFGNTNLAAEIGARIHLYQKHQPYRAGQSPE
jgi:protein O-mannosyl-transferase